MIVTKKKKKEGYKRCRFSLSQTLSFTLTKSLFSKQQIGKTLKQPKALQPPFVQGYKR